MRFLISIIFAAFVILAPAQMVKAVGDCTCDTGTGPATVQTDTPEECESFEGELSITNCNWVEYDRCTCEVQGTGRTGRSASSVYECYDQEDISGVSDCVWDNRTRAAWEASGENPVEEVDEDAPDVGSVVSGLRGLNQFPGNTIQSMFGLALKYILGLLGGASLIIFIYAGLLWMFSGGNAERRKKSMQLMLWTAAGIFMMLASYSILRFVLQAFGVV